MEWIPNQPLFFGDQNECNSDDFEYVQISDNTDTSQFQLRIEPCISAQQFLINPSFANTTGWDFISNWTFNPGSLCADNTQSISESTQTIPEGYWLFNVDVSSITGSIGIWLDGIKIALINTPGSYNLYGMVSSGGGGQLELIPEFRVTVCFTKIEAYPILTNLIVPIYNKEGVYQTEINFNDNPEYFVFAEDSVTVTIDWAELGLSNGCFYLCLLDPCVNSNGQNYPAVIANPGFTGNRNSWEGSGLWIYGTNDVEGTYAGGDNSNDISQPTVFNSFTTTFCIDINVTSITGSFDVYFGENKVDTITTSGVHRVCGIPSGNFGFSMVMVSGTATVTSVNPVIISPSDYECNSQSKLIKLADFTNACTLLLNACNNENGLGFIFRDSGFSPRIRLDAKLKNSKYTSERSVYEDSQGKRSVYYFSGKKQKVLAIDLIPEYIHDFLRLSLGFDNFYIDGVNYFVEDDEYSIEYPENFDFVGKVKINVSEKTQNVKNVNCSDDENNCTLPPNYLLRSGASGFLVQTDGFKIIING